MYDSIRGRLIEKRDDVAVIDAGGLRLRCDIPLASSQALGAAGSEAELLLRIRLNVNEGDFLVFGFATETERECFDILTSITGIGPRKAMAILGQIEIVPFARAVVANDLRYLASIKGIGKKTAERLVIELREKMLPYTQGAAAAGASLPGGSNVREALEALIVLGCRPAVAEKAIAEAIAELGEKAPTEQLVRLGLKKR